MCIEEIPVPELIDTDELERRNPFFIRSSLILESNREQEKVEYPASVLDTVYSLLQLPLKDGGEGKGEGI